MARRLLLALALTIGSLLGVAAPAAAVPSNCTSYGASNAQWSRCTQGTGYFRSYAACIFWNGSSYYGAYVYGAWVWVPDAQSGQWSIARCGSGGYWFGGVQ